jgi:hypothetical protein
VSLNGQPLHILRVVRAFALQGNNVIHLPAGTGAIGLASGGAGMLPHECGADLRISVGSGLDVMKAHQGGDQERPHLHPCCAHAEALPTMYVIGPPMSIRTPKTGLARKTGSASTVMATPIT